MAAPPVPRRIVERLYRQSIVAASLADFRRRLFVDEMSRRVTFLALRADSLKKATR